MLPAWDPFSAEWRRSGIAGELPPKRLSRLLAFQVGLPLAERRQAVHPGAVDKGALRGGDIFGLSGPGLLWGVLQRTAVGESELPGERGELVHSVEVGGRLLVGLAAREECNARHRARHAVLQHLDGLFSDFLDRGLLARLLARHRHIRL